MAAPPKKKNNKRSSTKYPAFNPKLNTRLRQEFLDIDYVDKLSEEEKEFLHRFMEEEVNASFSNTNKDINKTKEEKRAIYNKNNARNRCLYSNKKATGLLEFSEDPNFERYKREFGENPTSCYDEDLLIEVLDRDRAASGRRVIRWGRR